jgi:hypothetical protein
MWSFVCRAEEWNRLRGFGNREMRGMFGSETEKVTGVWRRLLNGEFYNLYSSLNIMGLSFQRGCASRVEHMGENGNIKSFYTRTWRDFKDAGRYEKKNEVGLVDWIYLAQDRDHLRGIVNMVTIFRIPYYCGNFLTSIAAVSFSRTQFHALPAATVQQSHAPQQLQDSRQFIGYVSGTRKLLTRNWITH